MMEDLTLRKSLQLAVKTEQLGARYYERIARRFSDQKEIADIFTQLARDERSHETQFRAILDSAPEEEGESRYEVDQYVRAVAVSEFFRIEQFKNMGEVKSEEDALGAALAFEKSTLLYYQALKDIVHESSQLDSIIQAEKNHIMSLTKIIVTDARFRGIRDNW